MFTLTIHPNGRFGGWSEQIDSLDMARLRAAAIYSQRAVTITDEAGVEYRRFS